MLLDGSLKACLAKVAMLWTQSVRQSLGERHGHDYLFGIEFVRVCGIAPIDFELLKHRISCYRELVNSCECRRSRYTLSIEILGIEVFGKLAQQAFYRLSLSCEVC